MGSVDDAYDDAMFKSFFATLEYELLRALPLPGRRRKHVEKYSPSSKASYDPSGLARI